MVTKIKDMAGAEPAAIAEAVAASAQQIWQAGLGAFAKAQRDGGALFDTLVRDGAQLHKLTQELAGDKGAGMTGKVGRLASGSWDRIEKIFEDRVARSLRSLGVPSREEVEALRREIDLLKAAVARRPAPKAAKTARQAGAVKETAAATTSATPKRAPRGDGTRARA